MANKKRKYDFNRFTDFYGSIDLSTQTTRKTWEFDLLDGVYEFDAVVLTEPIPVDLNQIAGFFGLPEDASKSSDSDEQQKYSFQARIISKLSPHQFVANPPDIKLSTNASEQESIQDGYQLHTTVFGNSMKMKPTIGDYVRIKLKPGDFVYDLKRATLVEKLTNLSPQARAILEQQRKVGSAASSPASSAAAFKKYSGGTILHPDTQQWKATYKGQEVLNGRLPPELLQSPPPDLYRASFVAKLLPEAIESFVKLAQDYKKEFKEPIWLQDSYRDYGRQAIERASGFGAPPGRSNHGWGVAIDVNGTRVDVNGDGLVQNYDRFRSKVYKWLDNGGAGRYGWVNPTNLRENGNTPESWHWENTTIRDQFLKNRTLIPNYAIPDGEEKAPKA